MPDSEYSWLDELAEELAQHPAGWRTWILVWVVDPVTKRRHTALKMLSDVKPTDERVKL